jgi:hypothetical protein
MPAIAMAKRDIGFGEAAGASFPFRLGRGLPGSIARPRRLPGRRGAIGRWKSVACGRRWLDPRGRVRWNEAKCVQAPPSFYHEKAR